MRICERLKLALYILSLEVHSFPIYIHGEWVVRRNNSDESWSIPIPSQALSRLSCKPSWYRPRWCWCNSASAERRPRMRALVSPKLFSPAYHVSYQLCFVLLLLVCVEWNEFEIEMGISSQTKQKLTLCLHVNKLPLSTEQLLQLGKILSLVVGELEPRLILHRSLAQVDSVIRILGFITITRPEVWCLESVERIVIFHRQVVIVDGKEIAMGSEQMCYVDGLLRIVNIDIFQYPSDEISATEHGWNLRHEAFHRSHVHATVLSLHLLDDLLHLFVY